MIRLQKKQQAVHPSKRHERTPTKRKLALSTPRSWRPRYTIGGVALLVVLVQLFVLTFNNFDSHHPILGLKLEGYTIGHFGGTDPQLESSAIIDMYENNKVPLTAGKYKDTVTMRQLSLRVDGQQVSRSLLQTGRTGNIFQRIAEQDMAFLGLRNNKISGTHFNKETIEAYAATVNKKISTPPSDARFVLERQSVIVKADTFGKAIDIKTAVAAILQADSVAANRHITIPIKHLPATLPASLLEPQLPNARRIAAQPLTVTANGQKVTLSREQLVNTIAPKAVGDSKNRPEKVEIQLDQTKLTALISTLLKKVSANPRPTIVQDGIVIQQGLNGTKPKEDKPVNQIVTALLQRETSGKVVAAVTIPMVTVPAPTIYQASPIYRTGTGNIQLTFDDGPCAYTQQILDILRQYQVHATFYMVGVNVQRCPGDVQRILREGHTVGNHTWDHADLTTLSAAGIQQELSLTQAAIKQAGGVAPTVFRPPYGAVNSIVQSVAASMGLSVNLWSVDPQDWAQPGSGAIIQRVLSRDSPGAIVLLHVLHEQTVAALPSIIRGIRAQGYTLQ